MSRRYPNPLAGTTKLPVRAEQRLRPATAPAQAELRLRPPAGLYAPPVERLRPPLTTTVFSYGSNLDPEQMAARCPSAKPGPEARMYGYRLAFGHRGCGRSGTATIRGATPGSWVPGRIWQISAADLLMLDLYEGVPNVYRRVRLEVALATGRVAETWVYVIVPWVGVAPPDPGYVDRIIAGYKTAKLSFAPLIDALREASNREVAR